MFYVKGEYKLRKITSYILISPKYQQKINTSRILSSKDKLKSPFLLDFSLKTAIS